MPSLRDRDTRLVALAGAASAVLLTPILPAGLPVLCALLGLAVLFLPGRHPGNSAALAGDNPTAVVRGKPTAVVRGNPAAVVRGNPAAVVRDDAADGPAERHDKRDPKEVPC
jgi:hypothetical protein